MRKIVLAFIILQIFANSVNAQLLGTIKINPSDFAEVSAVNDSAICRIMEKTIRPGLFIVKRSFQVQDKKTKELFGINGKQEFGIVYSLGIKTPNGFCVTDQAISPWIYNNTFNKYKEKYLPVISQTEYIELENDSAFSSFDELTGDGKNLCDSVIYEYESSFFNGNAFKIDSLNGDKDGWIVWITENNENEIIGFSDVHIQCQEKELLVDKQNTIVKIENAPADKNVIGGIYVIPVFKGIGKIEMHLCGVLFKVNDHWNIYFPFIKGSANELSTNEETNVSNEEVEKLTPIEKNDKPKKKIR